MEGCEELQQEKRDATECALAGCGSVGLYTGLDLTCEEFRAKSARDLVEACGLDCPIEGDDLTDQCLIQFREAVRTCLRDKGYEDPAPEVQFLCSVWKKTSTPWTWGDWCDWVAQSL